MKRLLGFGKINFSIGIIFILIGIILYIEKNGSSDYSEQYLPLAFTCLGISMIFTARLYRKE